MAGLDDQMNWNDADSLTGGSNSVDSIDGADRRGNGSNEAIQVGDCIQAGENGKLYRYKYIAYIGTADGILYIRPATNPDGNFAWALQGGYFGGLTVLGNLGVARIIEIGTPLTGLDPNIAYLTLVDIVNGVQVTLRGLSPTLSFDSTGGGNPRTFIDAKMEYYIGTPESPGANILRIGVSGDLDNINGSYGTLSDKDFKRNIVDADVKEYLEKFMKIRFVEYFHNFRDSGKLFGAIAQEVEKVFPKLVTTTPATEAKEAVYDDEDKLIKKAVEATKQIKTLKTSVLSLIGTFIIQYLVKQYQEQQKQIVNQEIGTASILKRLTILESK